MKFYFVGSAVVCLLAYGFQGKQTLTDKVTLDVKVGSITTAVEELSRASGIPMKVVGPAINDTVFLHIQDRPTQEVMDQLAKAVHAEWTLGKDGTYVLTRSYKEFELTRTEAIQENIIELEQWRADLLKTLDVPFETSNLAQIMTEYRKITENDREESYDPRKEDEATKSRRKYLQDLNPMARAMARCIAKIDFKKLAITDGKFELKFASNANMSQTQLPAGYGSAMSNLPSEIKRWAAELAKHPEKKTAKEIEEEKEFKESQGSNENEEEQEQSEEDKQRILDFLASEGPWDRTKPLPKQPTTTLLTFSRSYGDSITCHLQMFDQAGNPLISYGDYVVAPRNFWKPDAPKLNLDVRPSADTLALWTLYNQTDGYQEVKTPPESYKTLEPYFNNPLANDPLRIGNQEILTKIGNEKNKSVVACLPDELFQCYASNLSTEVFLNKPDGDVKAIESENWMTIQPTDFKDHWRHRTNREAMKAFSEEYRQNGKVEMNTFVKTLCGEFGYSSDFTLHQFMKEVDPKANWNFAPGEPAFHHLFLTLTDSQWARIAKGERIPYRELSEPQLQLISKIVYGDFRFGYVGGDAPNKLAAQDPSYELPDGLLSGGGLGGEIVYDDMVLAHDPKSKVEEERTEYPTNMCVRKERYVRQAGCGMGFATPRSYLFEFRKQKRISLHVYLSANHYYVGDFEEALPRVKNGRRYRFDELSPEMAKRVDSCLHVRDFDDLDQGTPPPK